MTAAPSLAAAAGDAFDNLQLRFVAGTIKSQLTVFWQQVLPTFPEADPGSRPVADWLTVLASLTDQMETGTPPLIQLTGAAEVMYRLCWMASFLQTSGGITNAQGAFLLASYNALIAF